MARRRGRRRPHVGEGPWRLLRVETGLEVACAHAQSVDEHRREAWREAGKGSGSRIGRRVRSLWRPRARQTNRVDHLEEDRAADGHLRTRRAAKEQKGGLGDVSRGARVERRLRTSRVSKLESCVEPQTASSSSGLQGAGSKRAGMLARLPFAPWRRSCWRRVPSSCRAAIGLSLAPMPRGARAPGEPSNPRRSLAGAKAGAGTAVELWRLAEALRRVLEAPLSTKSRHAQESAGGWGLCFTFPRGWHAGGQCVVMYIRLSALCVTVSVECVSCTWLCQHTL